MAFKHGKNSKFSIDDSGGTLRDVSAYTSNIDMTLDVDLPDTTFYGSAARRRTVVGLKDGKFTGQFFHDTTATTGSWTVLTALYGTANTSTFSWGPEGSTTGLPRITGECRLGSLKFSDPVDGVVTITADFVSDDAVTIDTYP